jgi:hypothetical protein
MDNKYSKTRQKYRLLNKKKIQKYNRNYAKNNAKRIQARAKIWKSLNKDRVKILQKRDWEKHKELYNARKKDKYAANPKIFLDRCKKYRKMNREKIILRNKFKRFKLKVMAFHIYSNRTMACVLCGNSNFSQLALDHINGNGTKHRQSNPKANCDMYRLVKTLKYPNGYRVLCNNCNQLEALKRLTIVHTYMAKHRAKYKLKALEAYSNGKVKCKLCDVNDCRVLTLDHMNGGGRKELRELKIKGGAAYYKHLRDHNYPNKDTMRVLCFNHNSGQRIETPSTEFIKSVIDQMDS